MQEEVRKSLTAAQVAMYGEAARAPRPAELAAFYDLLQHYMKSLAAALPPGDVVHASHHSLQVCVCRNVAHFESEPLVNAAALRVQCQRDADGGSTLSHLTLQLTATG